VLGLQVSVPAEFVSQVVVWSGEKILQGQGKVRGFYFKSGKIEKKLTRVN